jgi:hypothetical protein
MTNAAAIGYMILAAKMAEMPIEHIKCLEGLMREQMDFITEEEAEDAYKSN